MLLHIKSSIFYFLYAFTYKFLQFLFLYAFGYSFGQVFYFEE